MWGRKGMARLVGSRAGKLAKNVNKEDFLSQLKAAWRPYIKAGSDVDEETKKAMERINSSGSFKVAFDTIGVTEEDVKGIVRDVLDEKPAQVIREVPKVGRNEPCPCGSGKKYKKCCGR